MLRMWGGGGDKDRECRVGTKRELDFVEQRWVLDGLTEERVRDPEREDG